jgi:adenine deaminase
MLAPPRPAPQSDGLERRLRVAQGKEAGDLLLAGGQVVNVFTERIDIANVIIADGMIAGVGPFDWQARETVDVRGQFVLPGFIDSHMHLESTMLTPAELARLLVPHGTTAVISDSHEIGNVLGVAGIDMLLAASAGLPLDFFFMASSCVPATHWEHAGAVLGPDQVADLLGRPRVLGLAEVMDIPAVLAGEAGMLAKLRAAQALGRILDGHAPGMTGQDLQAYVAAGIRTDHESATAAEARAKAALGMLVQVREGSVARNLDAILPLLASDELGDFWCLVTDDVFPDELRRHGHIDGLLRRLVAGGVRPAAAIRNATLVPARHYGLLDRGAVAPSYRADIVVVDSLQSNSGFDPRLVIKDGQVVARAGQYLADKPPEELIHANTIRVAPMDTSAFRLPLTNAVCPVIGIIPGQILTRLQMQTVGRAQGEWSFDPELDVALIASIERHRRSGSIGLGMVSGFGLRRHGALGSSVAHDSHNLVIAGTNARDMLACVRALEESGGGFVAASGGEVKARLPLPIAGLLSTASADVVCHQQEQCREAARAMGCNLAEPFGTLSFLALPVIPELRITDQGVFDVGRQEFVRF